jgi:hypothetical protein
MACVAVALAQTIILAAGDLHPWLKTTALKAHSTVDPTSFFFLKLKDGPGEM